MAFSSHPRRGTSVTVGKAPYASSDSGTKQPLVQFPGESHCSIHKVRTITASFGGMTEVCTRKERGKQHRDLGIVLLKLVIEIKMIYIAT